MKKLYTISILVMVLLLVTGCSTGGYPLTQEESDAIAQYSAHLLLKYSKNNIYTDKLMDKKDYEETLVTPKPTEAATPTPKPTATIAPTEIPEDENDESTPTPLPTEEPAKPTESVVVEDNKLDSLSEIFGNDYDVTYVKHYIGESFSENSFLTLSAPEGKQLCIVTLNIKNNSKKTSRIKAENIKVAYMLYNGSKLTDTAELSLLSNDIQFLDDDIEAGKSMEAVILFYITDAKADYTLRFKSMDSGKIFDIDLK